MFYFLGAGKNALFKYVGSLVIKCRDPEEGYGSFKSHVILWIQHFFLFKTFIKCVFVCVEGADGGVRGRCVDMLRRRFQSWQN